MPKPKDPRTVAVVGATGAVGEVVLRLLHERGFPVGELRALASERSAGTTVSFAAVSQHLAKLRDAGDGKLPYIPTGESVEDLPLPALDGVEAALQLGMHARSVPPQSTADAASTAGGGQSRSSAGSRKHSRNATSISSAASRNVAAPTLS